MTDIHRGHALNTGLQSVYEQAFSELSEFGRETDRYYCRRIDRYVSRQEVKKVVALESVLQVLEDAHDVAHALELLDETIHNFSKFTDLETHSRYVELIENCKEQSSSMGAFPEDTKFWYPRS